MTYDEFKEILKKCNLTIKEFANMCGLNPANISGAWKSKNEVPKWVETWLENYQKAKIIDDIKEKVCPVKGNDE
jgi:transcriptional regulator with XRE-family HTH domain